MTVLVTAESKHGATSEIADRIGAGLAERGIEVSVRNLKDVGQLAQYEAFVVGSAVYMGKWLKPATSFVDAHVGELSGHPTWLFSSGPVVEDPAGSDNPGDRAWGDKLAETAHARQHKLFAGKLDRSKLGRAERAVTRMVRAPDGDRRDWQAIDEWAAAIARDLQGTDAGADPPPFQDIDAADQAVLRDEAARHVQEHSIGEAARIGRLSRIREFVLGAQDGLLVPLGVVTGMAAAHPARALIIVAGLAEAVAGAISMGGGSFLASQAEEQLYVSEIAAERREIQDFPQRETDELAIVLEREGLQRAHAETVARGLASNPNVFLRTKVQKELGLSPDAGGAAVGDATVVGATYLAAAVVPLWPYFFFSLNVALGISLACTLFALFAVGVAKGQVTRLSLRRSGLQVMVVGSISAGVGFAIGHLVTTIYG